MQFHIQQSQLIFHKSLDFVFVLKDTNQAVEWIHAHEYVYNHKFSTGQQNAQMKFLCCFKMDFQPRSFQQQHQTIFFP